MKLKKILTIALFVIMALSFANIFDYKSYDQDIYDDNINSASLYNQLCNNYEDLIHNYVLMFASVDNIPSISFQNSIQFNFSFVRKNQQNKLFCFKSLYLVELLHKVVGLSRFDLSFAALHSKHVLCYIFFFCRILT